MFKKYFLSEDLANQALEEFTDKYIDDNDIQYIAVIKKRRWLLGRYRFFLDVGILEKIKKEDEKENRYSEKRRTPKVFEFKVYSDEEDNYSLRDQKSFVVKKINVNETITDKIYLDTSNFNSEISISNESVPEGGTLGAFLELQDFDGVFGISNWHVLHHDGGELNQKIYYPRRTRANTHNDIKEFEFGYLFWANNKNLDVGIFKIEKEKKIKILREKGIKYIKSILKPTRGMAVEKLGARTGKTYGKIRSVNCTTKLWISVEANKIYRNQLQLDKKISSEGDSGSILFSNNDAVGIIFGSTNNIGKKNYSYANNLMNILNYSFDETQEIYFEGKKEYINKLILK